MEKLFSYKFGRLGPLDVVSSQVLADDEPTGVEVVAVGYELPEDVPFGALAYELGREILRATPSNSRGVLGGDGTYLERPETLDVAEVIVFFPDRETVVFLVSDRQPSPIEEIAGHLHQAMSTASD